MREWKIAQLYNIMDYDFAVGVACDDPHVLGIFANYVNAGRLFLIHEFSYKEEFEIDYFSTEVFPTIVRNYIIRKKLSSSSPYEKNYVYKKELENYFYKTLQGLEI